MQPSALSSHSSHSSYSADDNQNSKTSCLSKTLSCCSEFVRSIDPGYGYHKQNDDRWIQFDFHSRIVVRLNQ